MALYLLEKSDFKKDVYGRLLILAIPLGRLNLIKALYKRGANLTIKNNFLTRFGIISDNFVIIKYG